MPYEVTATRKRPRTFEELVGQEFVAATLAGAIRQNRIAHAYLFAGPRGVGKTSVARILARALNCEQGPTDKPCGACASCTETLRGAALDVIEIDGASNTSVNDVRAIRDEVLFPPQRGRYKVYIIDEVHMLSTSAFNALLKTIEEPPPYIVFIFATTEVHKVPATIRSRCQQYNFRLIGAAEIKEKLREAAAELGVTAEDKALAWMAREATGSLRDAYTLLDQVAAFSAGAITLERIREKLGVLGIDELNELARLLAAGNAARVIEHADTVLAKGVALEQLVVDLAEYVRNLLFIRSGVTRDTLLGAAAEDFDRAVLERWSPEQLEKAIEMLLALYRSLRFSLNTRFELELVLARLARLDDLVTPVELREAIAALRGGSAGSTAQPQRPAASRPMVARASAAPAPRQREQTVPQPAAAPPATPSRAAAPSESAVTTIDADPRGLVEKLAESFRREKPAILAALGKANPTLEGGELVLAFSVGDRFQGELVLKERDALNERLARFAPARIRVSFAAAAPEAAGTDSRVELLRKVFRGEIVQEGEGRGGQSL